MKKQTTNWFLIFLRLKMQEICKALSSKNAIPIYIAIGFIYVADYLSVHGEITTNIYIAFVYNYILIICLFLVIAIGCFMIWALVVALCNWLADNVKKAKEISAERKKNKV